MAFVLLLCACSPDVGNSSSGGGGSSSSNKKANSEQSAEELLVGRWEQIDGFKSWSFIEFFSDSTYTTDHASWNGDYAVNGSRLKISGVLNTEVYDFEFNSSGDELTLTNDAGCSIVYAKD